MANINNMTTTEISNISTLSRYFSQTSEEPLAIDCDSTKQNLTTRKVARQHFQTLSFPSNGRRFDINVCAENRDRLKAIRTLVEETLNRSNSIFAPYGTEVRVPSASASSIAWIGDPDKETTEVEAELDHDWLIVSCEKPTLETMRGSSPKQLPYDDQETIDAEKLDPTSDTSSLTAKDVTKFLETTQGRSTQPKQFFGGRLRAFFGKK